MDEPRLRAPKVGNALLQLIPTDNNVASPRNQDAKLHHAQAQLLKELTKIINVIITLVFPKSIDHLRTTRPGVDVSGGFTHRLCRQVEFLG